MKKLLLALLFTPLLCFAESSKSIDTILTGYLTHAEEEIIARVYYIPLNDPVVGKNRIPYPGNPIKLKRYQSIHIEPKEGYYVQVYDIKSFGMQTHFSACHNYMQVATDQVQSTIDVYFFNEKTGYCGVHPAPD